MELDLIKKELPYIEKYVSRGRFGTIFKGNLNKNYFFYKKQIEVAVKVYNINDINSFKNELYIYTLPKFKHDNILCFIKKKVIQDKNIFCLFTLYQENGSLFSYLENNLISLESLIQISLDIANGLNFLHGNDDFDKKIAHRDIKSKNILINSNLKACIADFDLAIFCNFTKLSKNLNQVGTLRYMSPEVLDNSIDFSIDSLCKVDIYACALVFWEILTRCTEIVLTEKKPSSYKLPFEQELGSFPSIEEMYEFVSVKRKRPIINKEWKQNQIIKLYCQTIEDCWNFDPEYRLTSLCIKERLKKLKMKI